MAYTPINWQTGQTITADKLNKMDNGWSYASSTETLFSESFTAEDSDGIGYAELNHSGEIPAEVVTITYDGIAYPNVVRFDNGGGEYWYGGFNGDPDFSTYPFALNAVDGNPNIILTETLGSHEITVEYIAEAVEVGADFTEAVKAVPIEGLPFMMTVGETTHDEFAAARVAGRPCFCDHNGVMVFVGWGTTNGDTYDLTIAPIPGAFTLRFNSSGILEAVIS